MPPSLINPHSPGSSPASRPTPPSLINPHSPGSSSSSDLLPIIAAEPIDLPLGLTINSSIAPRSTTSSASPPNSGTGTPFLLHLPPVLTPASSHTPPVPALPDLPPPSSALLPPLLFPSSSLALAPTCAYASRSSSSSSSLLPPLARGPTCACALSLLSPFSSSLLLHPSSACACAPLLFPCLPLSPLPSSSSSSLHSSPIFFLRLHLHLHPARLLLFFFLSFSPFPFPFLFLLFFLHHLHAPIFFSLQPSSPNPETLSLLNVSFNIKNVTAHEDPFSICLSFQ